MPCTREAPCGGMLIADRPLAAATRLELEALGIVMWHCLNGHAFRDSPVATQGVDEVRQERCPQHGFMRPCGGCADDMRRKRLTITPETEGCACGCGRPIPPGRTKYATEACAHAAGHRQRARGKTLTREELLRHRELLRVGLYQPHGGER